MSIDPEEAYREEALEQILQDAIESFAIDKLQSYYLQHPDVMRPAVDALQIGKQLQEQGFFSPAVVFYTSAMELFLKGTLLKPVLHGLILDEDLSDYVSKMVFKQMGYQKYTEWLAVFCNTLGGLKLKEICIDDSNKKLLPECKKINILRDHIVHEGEQCKEEDAETARKVSVESFEQIVNPMLNKLGLAIRENKGIVKI